jgi:hypothetical protein
MSNGLRKALDLSVDALTDAAQFIDAVRQDAIRENWWSAWDQEMREKITSALLACAEQDEVPR